MSNPDIEQFIHDAFERNYERLRGESGHTLAPHARKMALNQVLAYWRKLRGIAEAVTDTEVKLNLPNQTSPGGRKFCIEGVVDIVRGAGETIMYDIKTHDLDSVKRNKALYQKQLNVYAHIWTELRGERLDKTAIISTRLPDELAAAFREGEEAVVQAGMDAWDPVVELPLDEAGVAATVAEFGQAVDDIEDGRFRPVPLARLAERDRDAKGKPVGKPFASRVCGNCDARHSCATFQRYATQGGLARRKKKRANAVGPNPDEEDVQAEKDDNLEAQSRAAE